MVMTSAQIAQMNGAYQGQSMNQMAYSGMIAQQSPYSGERMAGGTMNAMGALASPTAMGGMALAGLDPVSMGITGGMAGFSVGGMAGAAAGALGGAALAAAPIMAAQYAGGQFMQGAQQHQQLGAGLRSSFGFRNQQGGTGFSGGQIGQIGSSMRGMASEQGPGGEMVSFDELGRLASNMGRMGMAQGVKNAKDFTDKFKTMVKSLKEIATEMGTSLEEAQKMMAGMKQSGVFGNANQVAMSKAIRIGAQAGGLATSELTGMASVGSQISRMVGGRGSAGAAGGMDTITNIGVAQQMGILSEEDIYNQTGETGAMGRRSMAVNGMQRAASFYKSGMGRRMLASMAGKNGQLDEGDAEEIAGGGVSVDRARQMWQQNMKGVGQANFIRNEGRLRGEALKKFGALGPTMWMKQLMEQKGINVDEDNDRAMLFLQRRMKMGRDEADNELKMIKNLPAILKERKIVGQEEGMAQRMKARQQTTGIEGLKRKLDKAVADVNGDIQEAGAGFMQNLENEFEGVVNYLTGTRVKEFRRDVVRALDTARGGGSGGKRALSQTFGIGGGVASNLQGLRGPGQSDADRARSIGGGNTGQSIMTGENISAGRKIITEALGLDSSFMNEFDRADRGRLAERGYQVDSTTQAGVSARMKDIRGLAAGAGGGGSDVKLSGGSKKRLNDMYSQVTGLGEERAKNVEKMLMASDDQGDNELGLKLQQAKTAKEKGSIIAGLNKALGRPDEGKLFATGDEMGVHHTSDYLTVKDQASAIGEALLGTTGERRTMLATGEQNRKMYSWLGGKMEALGLITDKSMFAKDISEEAVAATGAFAKTDEGREMAAAAIGTDKGVRDAMATEVQGKIAKLEAQRAEEGGTLGATERGQLEYMRSVRAAQKLQDIGGKNSTPEAKAKAAKEMSMTPDQFMTRASGIVGLVGDAQREARAQVEGVSSRKRVESMEKGGLIEDGKLNSKVAKAMTGKDGKLTAGGDFLAAMVEQEQAMSGITKDMDAGARDKILNDVFGEGGSQSKQDAALRGMDVSEMRELASTMSGGGASEKREMILGKVSRRERLAKGGKGSALQNLSGMLGAGVDKKQLLAALKGGEEGADARISELLVGGTGVESDAGKEAISKAVSAMRKGGPEGIAEAEEAISGLGGELGEAKKKKTLAAQKESNPLQQEANNFLKNIDEKLKDHQRLLSRVVNNTLKDAKDTE